jgi:hypothetical protein
VPIAIPQKEAPTDYKLTNSGVFSQGEISISKAGCVINRPSGPGSLPSSSDGEASVQRCEARLIGQVSQEGSRADAVSSEGGYRAAAAAFLPEVTPPMSRYAFAQLASSLSDATCAPTYLSLTQHFIMHLHISDNFACIFSSCSLL